MGRIGRQPIDVSLRVAVESRWDLIRAGVSANEIVLPGALHEPLSWVLPVVTSLSEFAAAPVEAVVAGVRPSVPDPFIPAVALAGHGAGAIQGNVGVPTAFCAPPALPRVLVGPDGGQRVSLLLCQFFPRDEGPESAPGIVGVAGKSHGPAIDAVP